MAYKLQLDLSKIQGLQEPPPGIVTSIDFSSDSRFLAIGHESYPYITVYKKNISGVYIKVLNLPQIPDSVVKVTFSEKSSNVDRLNDCIAFNTLNQVYCYKIVNDSFISIDTTEIVYDSNISTSSFGYGNIYFLLGKSNGNIELYTLDWALDKLVKITEHYLDEGSSVTGLDFAPNSRPYFAVASRDGVNGKNNVIFKIDNGLIEPIIENTSVQYGNSNVVKYSPNGRYLAIGIENYSSFELFRVDNIGVNTNTYVKIYGFNLPITSIDTKSISFSSDSNYLSICFDGAPYTTIFKIDGNSVEEVSPLDYKENVSYTATSFSPDGGLLVLANVTSPYIDIYNVSLEDVNSLDVDFNVPYGEGKSYKNAIVDIPYRTNLFSSVIIEQAKFDGLYGQGYNPYRNYFKGEVLIPENNILDVNIGILQPPITELFTNAVKDTYTRESRATQNFGSQETMVAGVGGDGRYISYIEIPLDDVINEVTEVGMSVVAINLILSKLESTNGTIDLYDVYSTWGEYFLMWITPIDMSPQPIASKYTAGNEAIIDLKDFVLQAINEGKTKLNLAIKSDHLVIFNTRESGSPVTLLTRYADPNWLGFIDSTILVSNAIIRKATKNDFIGAFKLIQRLNLISSAHLKEAGMLFSGGEIVQPNLFCSVNIVGSKYLLSEAMIRQRAFSDLESSVDHNDINRISSANIPNRYDLFSEAQIASEAQWSDLISQVNIARDFMFGVAEVVKIIDLNSEAIIRRSDNFDFNAFVQALNFTISGVAQLKEIREIVSEVVIRERFDDGDLVAKSELSKFELYSSFNLRKSLCISSEVVIRIEKLDRIDEVEIVKPYILSSGIIRRIDYNNLLSQVVIPYYDDSLKGEVIIRRTGNTNLISESIFRSDSFKDLISDTSVYRHISLGSEVDIHQVSFLLAQAIRRQSNISDSGWEAFVTNGWYHNYFLSEAFIRQRYVHLPSFAIVNTPARVWIPNINRRLPRLWVRENFIQD